MVGEYPATAALRRRAARMQANGQALPPDDNNEPEDTVPRQSVHIRPARRRAPRPQERDGGGGGAQQRRNPPKLSSLYCLVSLFLALLAIITSSSSSSTGLMDNVTKNSATDESLSVETNGKMKQQAHSYEASDFIFKSLFSSFSTTEEKKEIPIHSNPRSVPPLLRWMLPPVKQEEQKDNTNPLLSLFQNMIDPALLHPQPSTLTDIIDKILTSTPRILCICNVLLAFTWLLHSMVANVFLGQGALQAAAMTDHVTNHVASRQHSSWAGRERLGGFLVFKLLLISAVVAPDTLDLLILLSWYTLLSFLKSLASLCAATTAHTSASGQPPRRGVLRLLLVVLLSNVLAAAFCVALFHGAGWGMVLLLTCDCALLLVDVLVHALSHISQVLEDGHSTTVRELEERQVDIHSILNGNAGMVMDSDEEQSDMEDDVANINRMEELRQESRQLDRRMELLETFHSKRISILDGVIFAFQLLAYAITVAHFVHIWSLHGLQFTLIDGVLALHLHSALSSAGKRICERRNLSRIARDLDGLFDNASEVDMRKAGDVCCICLVTMTTGNVKRVGCGHLYHTHCLREVVERARSIEAAKCPLCRASVLDGRHHGDNDSIMEGARNDNAGNANDAAAGGGQQPRDLAVQPPPPPPAAAAIANALPPALGEHALFRFSTENILPAWMPLPAFSFEVVRRPPVANPDPAAADQQQQDANRNNDPPRPSFFRRLLIMAGAIPMSPEEVAMYLDQLVDMFPQYDRADLLRELRMRGSSEAVVEAVLMGVFSGVPRGGGDLPQEQELPPPRRANDAIQQDTAAT